MSASGPVLAACSAEASSGDTLIWYTNPDSGGQAQVAENCSTDDYTIETQVLPQDANEQRIQLARRLAAEDSGIDIMSIDPPFTAEFSNAGFLAPLPKDLQDKLTEQSFKGATEAATWDGEMVVAPFWSNTQVLWYRKSFVEKAGIDMSKPVTWDQIIETAAKNGAKVAVQANKYEGYVVWINALISGAGGEIATDTDKGLDMKLEIDSQGRRGRRRGDREARALTRRAGRPVRRPGGPGRQHLRRPERRVHGQLDLHLQQLRGVRAEGFNKDIGYTRYPQTVEGEDSRPPYGGIGLGVSAYSNNVDQAMEAIECITSPENQGVNAELTGNMPASSAGYDYPALKEIYPQDLLDLFQQSLDAAAPRTVTPYWSDISGGLQSTWHPPSKVNASTPAKSQAFIEDVLHGRSLL